MSDPYRTESEARDAGDAEQRAINEQHTEEPTPDAAAEPAAVDAAAAGAGAPQTPEQRHQVLLTQLAPTIRGVADLATVALAGVQLFAQEHQAYLAASNADGSGDGDRMCQILYTETIRHLFEMDRIKLGAQIQQNMMQAAVQGPQIAPARVAPGPWRPPVDGKRRH